jgi:hypothetical protein
MVSGLGRAGPLFFVKIVARDRGDDAGLTRADPLREEELGLVHHRVRSIFMTVPVSFPLYRLTFGRFISTVAQVPQQ